MFTIDVKEKGKNEEFSFKDLEMFHQECYGGKIKQNYEQPEWRLTCQRCGQWCAVKENKESGAYRIVKTAMDGQERKVETIHIGDNVRVIQKKETK